MKMNDVEANLFALKMGSLKGIKRSTRVLLLDGNGGDSPKVWRAKEGDAKEGDAKRVGLRKWCFLF
jgi:hypothetical protein